MRMRYVILALMLFAVILATSWWDTSYTYRMPIRIYGTLDSTGIPAKITLNTTNFDYSHVKSDLSDLRITYYNETAGTETEVGIWAESINTSGKSVIWFNATKIDTTNTTYYLYYGNSGASSKFDGNHVFELFDDFDGTSLNTTKWTCDNYCSVSGGEVVVSYSGSSSTLKSIKTFGQGNIYEAKVKMTPVSNSWAEYLGFYDFGAGHYMLWDVSGTSSIIGYNYVSSLVGTSTFSFDNSNYYVWGILHQSTGTRYYLDYGHKDVLYTNIPTTDLQVMAKTNIAGTSMGIDWIRVYKYDSLHPFYGEEEEVSMDYIISSVINPDDTYELTNSTFQINLNYSDTITDTTATLYYNGVAYTNTSYSYDEYGGRKYANYTFEVSHPIVEVNGTAYTYSYNITYTNSSGTYDYSTSVYTQEIYFGAIINSLDYDEVVQEGTDSTINLLVDIFNGQEYSDSKAVLEFNGTNYTMNKINSTYYTTTLTMPSEDSFLNVYDLSVYYYVNDSVLRESQTHGVSVVQYSTPDSLCSDYIKDNDKIVLFNFQNKDYYAVDGEEDSSCVNDLFLFDVEKYYSSGHQYIFWDDGFKIWYTASAESHVIPFGGKFAFASHHPFLDNATFSIPSIADPIDVEMYIYNSSDDYVVIKDGQTAKWYLDTNTSNGKIENINTGNSIVSNGEYYVRFNLYNALTSSSGYTSGTWRDSTSDWFFNASYNYRSHNYLPYLYSDIGTTQSHASFKNYRNNEDYTYSAVLSGLGNVYETSLNGTSFKQIFFILNDTSDAKINVLTESDNYSAYIISPSSQLIHPIWSVYLDYNLFNPYGSGHTLLYKRENNESYATTLYRNIPLFVQDKYGICYFVPPYSPSNTSNVYTLSAYQTDCLGSSVEYVEQFPLLPTKQLCYVSNDTYIIDVEYPENVLFQRYITADKIYYTSSSDTAYTEDIDINSYSNFSSIELKVNNMTRCYYSSESNTLGLNSMSIDDTAQKLVVYPLLLIATTISLLHPFAFIFVFVLNDIFALFDSMQIFLLAAGVGIFSFVSNWQGERNLKTLLILLLLTGAYVIQINVIGGSQVSTTDLSDKIDTISNVFSQFEETDDLIVITTTIIPTFLLNLIIIILGLPAILIHLLFSSIYLISPPLQATFTIFENSLIVGAYIYIIIKGYEMARNMYRGV